MSKDKKELLKINSNELPQPFNYAVGLYGSKFLTELKNGRILGIKCPKCGKVYVPPRQVCGPCFTRMEELVDVGPEGTIGTFTILRFAFVDPETGDFKPVPYGYGFIKFNGADNLFQHYLEITDEEKIKIGAKVEPVWAAERKGTIKDIAYFRVID